MVAQHCEYSRPHWVVHLNFWNVILHKFLSPQSFKSEATSPATFLKNHVLWGGKALSGNNNIFPHHSFRDLFSGLTELLFIDSVYPEEACGVIKNLGGKEMILNFMVQQMHFSRLGP